MSFREVLRRLGPLAGAGGTRHVIDCEPVELGPFGVREGCGYDLVLDRLSYLHYYPQEWLKKAALFDGTYLLNNPFTVQSMEKHATYCAMARLGLKVPDTVLVPFRDPARDARIRAYTPRQPPFDLEAVARRIGYPLVMKPYDGSAGRGVSRIENPAQLHEAYDASGEMLMLMQKAIDGWDSFARSLSIGAETMVMRYDPDRPAHQHYRVDPGFLAAPARAEVTAIARLVNAFFGWEINSCETLVKDGDVYPIDYANACPDWSVTSLHYYFPWAVKTLVKWCVFVLVTGRRSTPDTSTGRFFEIACRPAMSYQDKLEAYAGLADAYFDTERYRDFCSAALSHIDDITVNWVTSPRFDRLLIQFVRHTLPPAQHDQVIAHTRSMLANWVHDQITRLHSS